MPSSPCPVDDAVFVPSPATVYTAVFDSRGRSRRKELEEEVSNVTLILLPCDSIFF